MNEALKARMFFAHLELERREGRRVTLEEIGARVARAMDRDAAFTATAVSRWMNGRQEPELVSLAALARVFGVDPGWLAFGEPVPSDEGMQTKVEDDSDAKRGRQAG